MKFRHLHTPIFLAAMGICNLASAQLFIDNAQFLIQPGASVTVQGDVTSNADIQGTGKLILNGSGLQNLNMGGFTVPNLEINNTANVFLTGNARIGTTLLFTNGKLILGANNLTLNAPVTATGMGAGKFLETNGSGQVIKLLTANVAATEIPVGTGLAYRPAFVTTTGTYTNANVGVRVIGTGNPNRPPKLSEYVNAYWPVTRTGITGTVTVAGQYADGDLTGTEANLRGYFFDGTDWSSVGETHVAATNRVSAPVTGTGGVITGMDKFVLVRTKVFLQGAYNTTTGLMTDALRTPTNLIPFTDPYRSSPYNFVHVANPVPETAPNTLFADQPSINDNLVDWVFVELRTNGTNPGATVLQTRSALLKRDGTIVDIDGVSPVTFNNTANGNYTIAVRHRNHIGISADPVANLLALNEKKSTAPLLDLTTATEAQIFGTAAAYTTAAGRNLLWAGNANFNTQSKYTGPANDKDYLLGTILGSVSTATVTGYSAGDLNFNRVARYTGPGNDKDFLLGTILTGVATTIRSQTLPQ